jgi:ABC-type antimicrobial peptide transport system permease subunit
VNRMKVWLAIVIGVSSAVAVVAVGLSVAQQHAQSGSIVGSPMTTGATTVQSTAPPAPQTPAAVPVIKGPAPLPPEEQGLPG